MVYNVVAAKEPNENVNALYRRFFKQIRSLGIVRSLKQRRHHARQSSKIVLHKECLNRLRRRATFEHLYRMGKISTVTGQQKNK